jgi:hypothetical protein
MSLEEVKKIITKMVEDESFEKEVLDNPKEALAGFDLSDDERDKLATLDGEKLKKLSMNLDRRLSKDESWWVDSIAD